MKLSVYSVLTAASLAIGARASRTTVVEEEDTTSLTDLFDRNLQQQLCRCEASWEHFYYRRLGQELEETQQEETRETAEEPSRHRQLYHHYDYTQAYLDGGYYVIEGVKVMPQGQCDSFSFRHLLEDQSTSESGLAFHQDVVLGMNDSIESEENSSTSGFESENSEESAATRDLTYYYGGHHQGTPTSAQFLLGLIFSSCKGL